jgi:hypothetical protein
MKKPPTDLVVFASFLVSVALICWLGVAGELLNEVAAKGLVEFVKSWQTLVAAMIALSAALYTVRKQANQRFYEFIRARSSQLLKEENLLIEMAANCDVLISMVASIPSDAATWNSARSERIARARDAGDRVAKAIVSFRDGIGPAWGSQLSQNCRLACLDQAFLLQSACSELLRRVERGLPPTRLQELQGLHSSAALGADAFGREIRAETVRIAPIIERLESKLLR